MQNEHIWALRDLQETGSDTATEYEGPCFVLAGA